MKCGSFFLKCCAPSQWFCGLRSRGAQKKGAYLIQKGHCAVEKGAPDGVGCAHPLARKPRPDWAGRPVCPFSAAYGLRPPRHCVAWGRPSALRAAGNPFCLRPERASAGCKKESLRSSFFCLHFLTRCASFVVNFSLREKQKMGCPQRFQRSGRRGFAPHQKVRRWGGSTGWGRLPFGGSPRPQL